MSNRRTAAAGILIVIALLAFLLRLGFAPGGLPYLHDWDEPLIASRALNILKTGDFNPHFFYYGSLLIYLNCAVDVLYIGLVKLSLLHPDIPLSSVAAIRTFLDSGWEWTISHPDFYLWNRGLTALLGMATVVAVYLLGAVLFNRRTGLIAAALLAVMPYHAAQSALVTPNVPAAFFMVVTVLFSALYMVRQKRRYFILALIFAGLAFAVKYNAGVIVAGPLGARLQLRKTNRGAIRPYDWALIPMIPLAIFLVTTPYAIIDFSAFREKVQFVSRSYLQDGHPGFTISPGWRHFWFQIRQWIANIGWPTAAVALVGLIALAGRPRGPAILAAPIAYTLLMSCTRVSFHRNFVSWYPWTAFLCAAGIDAIHRAALSLRERLHLRRSLLGSLGGLLAIVLILAAAASSFVDLRLSREPDTRSRAVDVVNRLPGSEMAVIAGELRLHQKDLRRLTRPYQELPLDRIISRYFGNRIIYLLPGSISCYPADSTSAREGVEQQRRYEPFRKALRPQGRVIYSVGSRRTLLNTLSIDPAVVIAGGLTPPAACAAMPGCLDASEFDLFAPCSVTGGGGRDAFVIEEGGKAETPSYLLPAGTHHLLLEASAAGAGRGPAQLRVEISVGRDRSLIRSGSLRLAPGWTPFSLRFHLAHPQPVTILFSWLPPETSTKRIDTVIAVRNVILEEVRGAAARSPKD